MFTYITIFLSSFSIHQSRLKLFGLNFKTLLTSIDSQDLRNSFISITQCIFFSETQKSLLGFLCSHIRFQCVLWLSIIMLLSLPFCCCCIFPAENSAVNPLGTFAQSVQVAPLPHTHAPQQASFNLQKQKTNRLNLRSECSHRATYQHPFPSPLSITHSHCLFFSFLHKGWEHCSVYFWVRFDFCPRLNEVFNQNASAKF